MIIEKVNFNEYTFVREKLEKVPLYKVSSWMTQALGTALLLLKRGDEKAYDRLIEEMNREY